MRYLRLASFGITVVGLTILVAAIALGLGATVVLTGLLIAWAGIVKVAAVHLWIHVAGLGSDRHDPIRPV